MPSRAFAFACTAACFLALDAAWLTAMGPRLYQPAIGHLLRPDVDWIAAALFYVLYIGGLVGFAVVPSASARDAAGRGALFGLVAYATYDLTNQATLRDWPWRVTLADLCWGTIVTAVSAAAAARITAALAPPA